MSALYFKEMPRTIKSSDYVCPVCEGRGRVPGRLPGRERLCDECHGTGRIAPIRREVLIKKLKERERA
jgi:DnaJ-class molecular chaperone